MVVHPADQPDADALVQHHLLVGPPAGVVADEVLPRGPVRGQVPDQLTQLWTASSRGTGRLLASRQLLGLLLDLDGRLAGGQLRRAAVLLDEGLAVVASDRVRDLDRR